MHEITLKDPIDFEGWREASRRLLAQNVPPDAVRWQVDGAQASLFGLNGTPNPPGPAAAVSVPRPFIELARQVALHANPTRWSLLYRLLVRLCRGERALLTDLTDPDVARAEQMAREVRRCAHKMKAFLRFKEIETEDGQRWLAWFEPDHHVVELTAPFFARRFAAMRWSIVTPYRTAHWDGSEVTFGPGGRRADVPADDALDDVWRAYYASIFNPARLNLRAMRREMPKKYWHNMPETRLIPGLAATATARTASMIETEGSEPARKGRVIQLPHRRHRAAGAGPMLPEVARSASLAEARTAAETCRACPLWERATQTVFGEGPRDAAVMLVGEQPGDQEDLAGRPFVGPAGGVLDNALAEAGLQRERLYLTNAVKHFKYVLRGKRRLHQRAGSDEIGTCKGWLDLERELVRPRLIVALGVTAATSLLGRDVTLQLERGRITALEDGTHLLVTAHPSFILRIPDPAGQGREYRRLVADLLLAAPYQQQAA